MGMVPVVANAKTFKELVDTVTDGLAALVVRFLFALAFMFFFWGVAQYVLSSEESVKSKGRDFMFWGIIGLTVMFAVYGLINILTNTIWQ